MSVSIKYSPFSKKRPKRGFSGKSFSTSYAFPAYTDCSTSTTTGTIYYAEESTLSIGSVLYTNSTLTVLAGDISAFLKDVVFNNGIEINTSSGEIIALTQCSSTYTFYEDCSNGGPTAYYTRYNDVIAAGTVLYTDDILATVASNLTYKILDNAIYDTNVNGVLSITGYCNSPITTYTNCADYNSGTGGSTDFYVRLNDYNNPLANGTKIYTDVNALVESVNRQFVWLGNIYDYEIGTGTEILGQCST